MTANFPEKSLAFTLGVCSVFTDLGCGLVYPFFFFQVLCIWISGIFDLFGGGEEERVGRVLRGGVV